MRQYLILKLLAINLLVIGFVMIIIWFSIDTLAAGYFVTLMEKYNISPKPAHAMFVSAIHRYLIWAAIGATVLAAVLSFILTRRVLSPLTKMTKVSQEIAEGNYTARVPVKSADEVGQLAEAFNRMAKSLHTIEKLRRTLMIDVAHELRTPLTNIRGYLEALKDGVVPPSPKNFSLLHHETLRLVRLVEDVLRLARADAAHGKLVKSPVDLTAMIKTALKPFLKQCVKKNLTVKIHAPDLPVSIMADQPRFMRVLRNLSENSVRYTQENGDVAISIEKSPDGIRVTYSNDATGLNEKTLPYLFERFYRGEQSRSRRHGGAGIGLSIVKELVEAHGGSVFADLSDHRIRIGFVLPIHPLTA